MSVPVLEAAPDLTFNPDDSGTWDIAGALADLNNITLPDGRSADLPLEDADDQPAPVKTEPVKPAAKPTEKPAERQPTTAEEVEGEPQEEDTPRYSKRQYERSRAEANRQRDKAEQERQGVLRQLAEIQSRADENEFQRGVMLLADQMMEQQLAQAGMLTPADKQVIQRQAWATMSERRAAYQQARVAEQTQNQLREQAQTSSFSVAEQTSRNIFLENVIEMQSEASAAGVPTFDVKTVMEDLILNNEKYQRRVRSINAVTDPALQKEATDDFYEDVKAVLRSKISSISDKKKTGPKAQVNRAQTVPAAPPAQAPSNYLKVDMSTLESIFDPDVYENTLAANPNLRIR